MTIEQGFALVTTWVKRFAALGLLIYVAAVILKLFGVIVLPQIATYDAQATGVLVAGIAFALGKT